MPSITFNDHNFKIGDKVYTPIVTDNDYKVREGFITGVEISASVTADKKGRYKYIPEVLFKVKQYAADLGNIEVSYKASELYRTEKYAKVRAKKLYLENRKKYLTETLVKLKNNISILEVDREIILKQIKDITEELQELEQGGQNVTSN